MKYKNILLILSIFLLSFSGSVSAIERPDRNAYPDGKFVDRFSSSSLRDDTGTGGETEGIDLDDPTDDMYALGPIGDALPCLLILGLSYGFFVFNRKRKTVEVE
jgi:hypothetical protein